MARRTIHKYRLDVGLFDGAATIEVPGGAKFLLFEMQDSAFHVWFEVEQPLRAHVVRRFIVVPTGGTISDGMDHLGSFQIEDPDGGGRFVWHLYEKRAG